MRTLNGIIKDLESILDGQIISTETLIEVINVIKEYKHDIADTVGEENVELYRMKLKELSK